MSGRVVTAAMEAEILRRWNETPSPSEIGRALGLARTTVQNVVRRAGLALNAPVWNRQEPAHQAKMGKVLDRLARAETNAQTSEIDELREALAAQNELIQRLLNGDKRNAPGQPPIAYDCEKVVRECDKPEAQGRILVIGDTHCPYHHHDLIPFLKALKSKYRPTHWIHIGDELDYHAMSYHESDPDLYSAGAELIRGQSLLRTIHDEVTKELSLLSSNHGDMLFRRARTAGTPKHLVVSYRDAIFADRDEYGNLIRNGRGDGWRWFPQLIVNIPNSEFPVTFVHGQAADVKNAVRRMHTHVVQGHYHTQADIRYEQTYAGLLWGMTVSGMVDDKSMAFAYNKNAPARPVPTCAFIENGVPRLLPLLQDRAGRWTGVVP